MQALQLIQLGTRHWIRIRVTRICKSSCTKKFALCNPHKHVKSRSLNAMNFRLSLFDRRPTPSIAHCLPSGCQCQCKHLSHLLFTHARELSTISAPENRLLHLHKMLIDIVVKCINPPRINCDDRIHPSRITMMRIVTFRIQFGVELDNYWPLSRWPDCHTGRGNGRRVGIVWPTEIVTAPDTQLFPHA